LSVSRHLWKLPVLAFALSISCATPTLPLPPPLALSTAPDPMTGLVTVNGSALPDAYVFILNQQTESGVIGTADMDGNFSIEIEAEIGDYLTVWQRLGSEDGPTIEIEVPAM
jgi:hypothetical protein